MHDLIDRQAAIDAILAVTGNSSVRELYEHVQEHGLSDMWSGGVNAAIDVIIAVPSAQPDVPDTNVGDTISRQAAIDALAKHEKSNGHNYTLFVDIVSECAEIIRDLPPVQPDWTEIMIQCDNCGHMIHAKREDCKVSAQPEQRTCVNCGRTVNNGGWYADGGTRCPIEEHYALPKDGYCHLWEKRNVTDDDYPEKREE